MKVLKYNSDDKVVSKNIDLDKLNDFVYYHNWIDSDRFNTEYTDIYLCIGNTIFEVQSYISRNTFNYKKDELMSFDKNKVLDYIFSGFQSTLKIEVAKIENLDVDKLIQGREQTLKARELERQQKEQAKIDEGIKRYEQRKEQLKINLAKFIQGEYISKEDFIELCKLNDIELHIRTIGMLNTLQKCDIKIGSAYVYGNSKKVKSVNLNKVFEAAKLLSEKYSKEIAC